MDAAADAILIGIGANLAGRFATPLAACEAAVAALEQAGVAVLARSRWYRSQPVPASAQPWFVNGVVRVATRLPPAALLQMMHGIEERFGRVRRERNAARIIDLDLLAYGRCRQQDGLELPHPRLDRRRFVLLPLAEVAPGWCHPSSGRTVAELVAAADQDQLIEPLTEPMPQADGSAP